jgi:hypothetical protein
LRTESYYLIKNLESGRTYILPLDEHSTADLGFLNHLCNRRDYNNKYDITSILISRKNLIDLNKAKSFNSDLDHLARISILQENQDLTKLAKEELDAKIKNIPDSVVAAKIETIRRNLEGRQLTTETGRAELEDFLTSLGLSGTEAKTLANQFIRYYKITSIHDLKHLSKDQLQTAYHSLEQPRITFDILNQKLQAFLSTFKH